MRSVFVLFICLTCAMGGESLAQPSSSVSSSDDAVPQDRPASPSYPPLPQAPARSANAQELHQQLMQEAQKRANNQEELHKQLMEESKKRMNNVDESHQRASTLLKKEEDDAARQEEDMKRWEKILDKWESQQAQYQKYLDSLPTSQAKGTN